MTENRLSLDERLDNLSDEARFIVAEVESQPHKYTKLTILQQLRTVTEIEIPNAVDAFNEAFETGLLTSENAGTDLRGNSYVSGKLYVTYFRDDIN